MPKGIPKLGHRIITKTRSDKKELRQCTCLVCEKSFGVKVSQFKWRTPKYCSRKCYKIGALRQKLSKCQTCGKEFSRSQTRIARYCSKPCSDSGRRLIGAKWRDKDQIRSYMKSYMKKNKESLCQRAREWTLRNPEKRRAIRRKWAIANRGWIANNARLRRTSGNASLQDWLEILQKFNHCCARCGSSKRIECDHIIPIARGGRHEKQNMQPLCRGCNAKKGAKILET